MTPLLCNFTLLTLYHTILTFNEPWGEGFENILGKGENAGTQHFLLFQKCFLPFPKQIWILKSYAIALNLDKRKICSCCKEGFQYLTTGRERIILFSSVSVARVLAFHFSINRNLYRTGSNPSFSLSPLSSPPPPPPPPPPRNAKCLDA